MAILINAAQIIILLIIISNFLSVYLFPFFGKIYGAISSINTQVRAFIHARRQPIDLSTKQEAIHTVIERIHTQYDPKKCEEALIEILDNPKKWILYNGRVSDNIIQNIYPLLQAASQNTDPTNKNILTFKSILHDVRNATLNQLLGEWKQYNKSTVYQTLTQKDWEYISAISQLSNFTESVESLKTWGNNLDFLCKMSQKDLSSLHPNISLFRRNILDINNLLRLNGELQIMRVFDQPNHLDIHDSVYTDRKNIGKRFLENEGPELDLEQSILDKLKSTAEMITRKNPSLKDYTQYLIEEEQKIWEQSQHHTCGIKELIQAWELTQTASPILDENAIISALLDSASGYKDSKLKHIQGTDYSCHIGNQDRILLYVGTVAESNVGYQDQSYIKLIFTYAQQYLSLLGHQNTNRGMDGFIFSRDVIHFIKLSMGQKLPKNGQPLTDNGLQAIREEIYAELLSAFPKISESWLFLAPFYSPQSPNANNLKAAVNKIIEDTIHECLGDYSEIQSGSMVAGYKSLQDSTAFEQKLYQYAKLQHEQGHNFKDIMSNMYDVIAHFNEDGESNELVKLNWLLSDDTPILEHDPFEIAINQNPTTTPSPTSSSLQIKEKLKLYIKKLPRVTGSNPRLTKNDKQAVELCLMYCRSLQSTGKEIDDIKKKIIEITTESARVTDAETWLIQVGFLPTKRQMFESLIRRAINNENINTSDDTLIGLKGSIETQCLNLKINVSLESLKQKFNESCLSAGIEYEKVLPKWLDTLDPTEHYVALLLPLFNSCPHEIKIVAQHLNRNFLDTSDEHERTLTTVFNSFNKNNPDAFPELIKHLSDAKCRIAIQTYLNEVTISLANNHAQCPHTASIYDVFSALLDRSNTSTKLHLNTFYEFFDEKMIDILFSKTNIDMKSVIRFGGRLFGKNKSIARKYFSRISINDIYRYLGPLCARKDLILILLEEKTGTPLRECPQFMQYIQNTPNHKSKDFILRYLSFTHDQAIQTENQIVDNQYVPILRAAYLGKQELINLYFNALEKRENVHALANDSRFIEGGSILAYLIRHAHNQSFKLLMQKIRDKHIILDLSIKREIINTLSSVTDRDMIQYIFELFPWGIKPVVSHNVNNLDGPDTKPEFLKNLVFMSEYLKHDKKLRLMQIQYPELYEKEVIKTLGTILHSEQYPDSEKLKFIATIDKHSLSTYKSSLVQSDLQIFKPSITNALLFKLFEYNLITMADRYFLLLQFYTIDPLIPLYWNHTPIFSSQIVRGKGAAKPPRATDTQVAPPQAINALHQ